MRMFTNTTILSALSALWLSACTADVDQPVSDSDGEQQTLATIDLDGASILFSELEPGFPIVSATSQAGRNPLADPAIRRMNLVEMYEHWTHQPAPERLRAAHERKLALSAEDFAAGEVQEAQAPDLAPEPAERGEKAALSGAEFNARYCGGFPICHLFVTGTGEYERRTDRVFGWVNPMAGGPVRLQVRLHKTIGGWRNILVKDIQHGWEWFYDEGEGRAIRRPTKVKVHEADGDTYHWSLNWN